jgi:hypothetical protein
MKWQVDETSWHLIWWTWLNEICSKQLSKENRWKSFWQNKLECFLTDNHLQPCLTFVDGENRLQANAPFTFAQGCEKMFTRLTVLYYYLGSLGIIIILKWNNFCCLNTQETRASIDTVSVAGIFGDANSGSFAIGRKYWTRHIMPQHDKWQIKNRQCLAFWRCQCWKTLLFVANIRLGIKALPGANALAYYA